MDLSFAHREDVGGDNLVDHVALKTTDGLSFGDDDNILVCIESFGQSAGRFNLAQPDKKQSPRISYRGATE